MFNKPNSTDKDKLEDISALNYKEKKKQLWCNQSNVWLVTFLTLWTHGALWFVELHASRREEGKEKQNSK